jgi:hypothetical protein
LALEALEADELDMVDDGSGNMVFRKEQAIAAIKKALAQPEQEPLTENGMYRLGYHNGYGFGEAYGKANAPQRTWFGLEKSDMPDGADPLFDDPKFIAGMVYAANKLKEKNNV